MQLIVFLGLLVGSALAATNAKHSNITVYAVNQERENVRYGPLQVSPLFNYYQPQPILNQMKLQPFIFVYPYGGKVSAVYMQNGFQGLGRYPDFVQALHQGNKFLVLAYPWQLPRSIVDHISGLDIAASAGHGHVAISQLAQLAQEISTRPVVLVQSRTEDQVLREEQLNEVGAIQVTHEGKVQIVRDVVSERLQDPKYGAFFNPYGFNFQGSNNAFPFNYGNTFPYFAFQSQYPGYGYQGGYPSFAFQGQYPYSGHHGQYPFYGFQGQYPGYTFQAQYPFYGFQGQHPSYGYQGQYYNYGPAEKVSPTFPGYNMGYNFPGYTLPFYYPTTLGNSLYPFGINYIPSPYYPTVNPIPTGSPIPTLNPVPTLNPIPTLNPFYIYGQRTPQEEATKSYSGYQYGSYPPFTFYAQQPQHQYGYQNQGYPFSYYQAYPFNQSGAKGYQYTPYQFQEYQYQPYHFQQYQPNYFQQQYQPFQFQYYQNFQSYQPFYGQYYPQ